MSRIELKNVTKSYNKNAPVIENLSLTIEEGSFTILLGPSGCGKSTILRMIAGLEQVDSGTVLINGQDMGSVEPGKRGSAMVFQNYALYPTMTVRENVEFGIKNMKVPKGEREDRIIEALSMVGLEKYMDRKPKQLSGGQCQRLALARAIVKKPKVFLMDEPLSNLDAQLRTQIRGDLVELHRKLGATFVFVTHDQIEAMSMGTNIVLLEEGKIRQQDSPLMLYDCPDNLFSARFIGSPSMNILKATDLELANMPAETEEFGFRPENALFCEEESRVPENSIGWKAKILSKELLGDFTLCKAQIMGHSVWVKTSGRELPKTENVYLHLRKEHLFFFDKEEQRIV